MANAAAKKAAAAKKEASKIYLPLLVVTNLIYLALLLGGDLLQTKWGIFGTLVTWAEQAYSYVGILENAATNAGNKKNKDLAGGSSLDLFAVTILVQFGSVLHSTKWLWGTVVGVPVVGAYSLYRTFYGSNENSNATKNSAASKSSSDADDSDDPMAAKRKRRAEKRRQKWN